VRQEAWVSSFVEPSCNRAYSSANEPNMSTHTNSSGCTSLAILDLKESEARDAADELVTAFGARSAL
jgi:hypothetical protein